MCAAFGLGKMGPTAVGLMGGRHYSDGRVKTLRRVCYRKGDQSLRLARMARNKAPFGTNRGGHTLVFWPVALI